VLARVPKFRVRATPILLHKMKRVVRFRSRFRFPNLTKRIVHIFKRKCLKDVFNDKFQEDFKVCFPQKIIVKEVFGRYQLKNAIKEPTWQFRTVLGAGYTSDLERL
jgi:hypothetical protein